MGYDLFSKQNGAFSANIAGWDYLTEAALAFDWKPAGTLYPIHNEDGGKAYETGELIWNGGYYSNDYQRVTDKDARELAAALRRAIAAAEDEGGSIEVANLSERAKNATKNLDVSYVRAFAEFCELGAFRIG